MNATLTLGAVTIEMTDVCPSDVAAVVRKLSALATGAPTKSIKSPKPIAQIYGAREVTTDEVYHALGRADDREAWRILVARAPLDMAPGDLAEAIGKHRRAGSTMLQNFNRAAADLGVPASCVYRRWREGRAVRICVTATLPALESL